MGQVLLDPPNVAGWQEERSWMSPGSWMMRTNFAASLFDPQFRMSPDAAELLPSPDPRQRATRVIELVLDGDVDLAVRHGIEVLAASSEDPADLLRAVASLPDAQML
jgi:hypothetical protein